MDIEFYDHVKHARYAWQNVDHQIILFFGHRSASRLHPMIWISSSTITLSMPDTHAKMWTIRLCFCLVTVQHRCGISDVSCVYMTGVMWTTWTVVLLPNIISTCAFFRLYIRPVTHYNLLCYIQFLQFTLLIIFDSINSLYKNYINITY